MLALTEENIDTIKKNYPLQIGICIKYFRTTKNITQIKLAELTGKDRQYIYKIEKGKVTPNIATLKIITIALGITSSEFFNELDK